MRQLTLILNLTPTLMLAFVATLAISIQAQAHHVTYECQAVDNPALKMALMVDQTKATYLLDSGTKIISDEGKFAYYDGADNQNFLFGGFKNWVSQVQGGNAYSGYLYVPGALLKTGKAQVALYRSFYRSEKDCGNESQWFDCAKD